MKTEFIETKIADCVNVLIVRIGKPTTLQYKNHEGIISSRRIIPLHLEYGVTEYHPEQQWFLYAFDTEKGAYRTFALKDFIMGG